MFHSTLYSLLLLPAFLLHTANASSRQDRISIVQNPKDYVVQNEYDAAVGEPVGLAQITASGTNLVVYQNGSISNPKGDLFIGTDSYSTILEWVSEPLPWRTLQLGPGFR
ncbi:hypothetical protein M378DRAFT_169662 [Amanita muscaria Koide BX008]|uniref:Uncharacterized protein n=1 Tax=Amanita muscaria (strain Koide BX008) TaxID=946122 RepID=A0A0C2S8P3_AMAMK|nr:hypothetical protein M378DRAFT_169662 [Amanita muscaria Koide BX008]